MEYINHLGIVLPEKKTFFKTLLNVRQAKTAYGLNEKVIANAVSKSTISHDYFGFILVDYQTGL